MDKENGKSQSALREEAVLQFWKEKEIFKKSLEKKAPKGDFVFFEGPPTANGKPGIHHLEARAFKDVIPRYKTMQGYYVRRKGGWDTHGLPVELQVEKELGLKSKKEIEEFGIAKFNQECKKSVWTYVDLWEKFTERIGFWVDQENPYVTYHNNYIESVWNVIKEVNKQNLLYKDYKVVPWCPRCGTALSSHELAQGYEDVKDLSVYVKFKLKTLPDTYILAWTTTPWTLPGNVALAVGEKIDYVYVLDKEKNEKYIVAKDLFTKIFPLQGNEALLGDTVKGKDLVGLEYESLYPFMKEQVKENIEKAYKIYPANFVTTEDGTGVVHTAVMYGQDDFVLGAEIGLPKHHLVGLDGKFLSGTGFLENRFVRDEEVAVDIIKDLAHRNLLFKKEKYEHSYPHCWRCHTALIYYARDSWYIRMSDPKIKSKLILENKSINWEPEHIKEGRFGEWLREIKDWAISRERYWGSPLPVWHCDKCKKIEVIGSVEDLKNKTKKSGNKYFVMRHGQADNNITKEFNKDCELNAPLTEFGKEQVLKSLNNFNQKIDIMISSTMLRAEQTAEIVSKQTGFPLEKIVYDERIQEWEVGGGIESEKNKIEIYIRQKLNVKQNKDFSNGESFMQLVKRVGDFIFETESKYKNKNILIVGHGCASVALKLIIEGFSFSDLQKKDSLFTLKNAEIKEFKFTPLPHNENYELDLHKPFIDEVELICDCGGKLTRTKEVMDVWLDSGTMPFSQDHYPFENKNLKYPADFISEAIDQTRGWFYTLHAVGVLMGKGKAYKNVICLGHLLDAKGKKMSKSLGNIIDPWEMIEKYGVDTLRLWMYAVNQPGESKNFDEKTVSELHNKVFNLLYNVLAFYELYRDPSIETGEYNKKPKNILDKWIIARLDQLTENTTKNLNNYKLLEPVREMRDFIDDLSTWYLRRSRERIKNEASKPASAQGYGEARKTLYFVLKELSKLMAPFAPFTAEDIWLKLRVASPVGGLQPREQNKESVHLTNWPKVGNKLFKLFSKKSNVIKEMEQVREIVTLGLQARQKAGIPIRQPLNKIIIRNYDFTSSGNWIDYLSLIKEELNIRNIDFSLNIDSEQSSSLDTEITPELKAEGNLRELVRAIQDMRKKMGLTPSDVISLVVESSEDGKKLIQKFENEMKKVILAEKIEFENNSSQEIKIDELVFKIEIKK